MSNFNKVVTNIPVSLTETEMSNLSQTLSGIIQGGGGGGECKRYIGDGVYVTVNNDANPGVISLTQTSLDKLNQEIPSAVSSFPDSVQYAKKTYVDSTFQTKSDMTAYATKPYVNGAISSIYYTNIMGLVDALNAKQDTLTFGYDENDAISSINSHEIAGTGGITGDYYSASNPSGFIISAQAETQILAKNYITSGVSVLDNFYSKTDTSSKTEIANAFDNIPKYILNGDSNITATSAQDGKNIRWDLSVNAHPTVTDTTLTGENGIYTHTTTKSGEWCVELVQTAYAAINDVQNKLDTSVAAETYQPIGNYLSSNALEGYATTALLDTISSKIENDIPTTVAQLTDSGNYYKTTETSSKDELSAEFTKYVTSSNVTTQDTDYVMTTTGWKVLTLPGGGMTQVIHDETLTGQGNDANSKLGVAWSALSSNTIDYSNSAFNLTNGTYVSSFDQISAAIDSRYSKTASDNRYLQKSLDDTLTGDGTTNKKLGVAWSALSGNTINSAKSADKAENLTDGTETSSFAQIKDSIDWGNAIASHYQTHSGEFVTSSNAVITGTKQYALTTAGWSDIGLSAYLPTSGGTVSGQLEVHGGSNFDSQFIKLTREGNSCGARIGLGSDTTNGTLALKTFNGQGQNTVQVNIKHNTNNNELIQVQKGGSEVGFLIPAQIHQGSYTPTSADGILHIVLES